MRLQRLARVYTCQNVKLLEISCRGSNYKLWLVLLLGVRFVMSFLVLLLLQEEAECFTNCVYILLGGD